MEQEQYWLIHGLPGSREGVGSIVKPGPPHTSPTVVLTGFTWKCGVGSSAERINKGDKGVNISPTNTCIMVPEEDAPGTGAQAEAGAGICGVQQEHPWLLHRRPRKFMRCAGELLEEE